MKKEKSFQMNVRKVIDAKPVLRLCVAWLCGGGLDIRTPSRGRELIISAPIILPPDRLDIRTPSRGRERCTTSIIFIIFYRLDIRTPSRGREQYRYLCSIVGYYD